MVHEIPCSENNTFSQKLELHIMHEQLNEDYLNKIENLRIDFVHRLKMFTLINFKMILITAIDSSGNALLYCFVRVAVTE